MRPIAKPFKSRHVTKPTGIARPLANGRASLAHCVKKCFVAAAFIIVKRFACISLVAMRCQHDILDLRFRVRAVSDRRGNGQNIWQTGDGSDGSKGSQGASYRSPTFECICYRNSLRNDHCHQLLRAHMRRVKAGTLRQMITWLNQQATKIIPAWPKAFVAREREQDSANGPLTSCIDWPRAS